MSYRHRRIRGRIWGGVCRAFHVEPGSHESRRAAPPQILRFSQNDRRSKRCFSDRQRELRRKRSRNRRPTMPRQLINGDENIGAGLCRINTSINRHSHLVPASPGISPPRQSGISCPVLHGFSCPKALWYILTHSIDGRAPPWRQIGRRLEPKANHTLRYLRKFNKESVELWHRQTEAQRQR